jgi:glycosyltransferase involved in cell wall biosynthesis
LQAGTEHGKALRVRFVGGYGSNLVKAEVEDQVRTLGLENIVSIAGQVPYAESLRAMARADILLLLDSPGRRAGVPAKLYEYLGAGRPILALAESDSDVAWVLSESNLAHRIAPPLDSNAIHQALLELIQDPSTPSCAGDAPDRNPRFSREQLSGELAELLDSCLDGRSSGSAQPAHAEAVR